MEKQNIKLVISYDGTGFLGWQKTKEGPSIEAALEKALFALLQEPIFLQASSRTDAGVHAKMQVVNFFTSKQVVLSKLLHGLNALLPKSISAIALEFASPEFHPTLDCKSKEYRYTICYGKQQLPHHRFFSWHVPTALNLEAMEQAASFLVGTKDFSAFCNTKKNETYENFVREVSSIHLKSIDENRLEIHILGKSFLYKMVRNIAGALVYAGQGKLTPSSIVAILESKDRKLGAVTAPAHGLNLYRINF